MADSKQVYGVSVSITDQLEQSDHCFSAGELARLLKVHKLTVYRNVKAGKLKAFYVGSAMRIQPAAAAAWLREK